MSTTVAEALADSPGVVRILLVKHVPDHRGRCQVCRIGDQRPAWPCALAVVAKAAQQLIDAGAAR